LRRKKKKKKNLKIGPPMKNEEEIKYQEDSVLSKLISSVQAQQIEIPYDLSPSIWTTTRFSPLLTVASEPQHLYKSLWLNSSP